jgi:glucose/mannose-6-phosphate isomerase
LDISTIQKYDTKKMYETYDLWPKMAKNEYEKQIADIEFGEISHVVFAGMGGSGAIGDIFSAILSKTNIHVDVVKGYLLPQTVNSKSLTVITSVSGNTEESLIILKHAMKSSSKIIAFSGGGKMEKFCFENKITHKKIEMKHSPRASFPAFLFGIIKILQPFLLINNEDVENAIKKLSIQNKKISSVNLTKENSAISLAKWIDKSPLIYYPWGLEPVAIRFKNSLQENSKIHASAEDIIEACHNGIVSWKKETEFKPILIQGKDDYIKTKERWKIIEEFFDQKEIEYYKIESDYGNILSKLINMIYFCDYVSIYKSVLDKINPSPVDAIDFVKNRL